MKPYLYQQETTGLVKKIYCGTFYHASFVYNGITEREKGAFRIIIRNLRTNKRKQGEMKMEKRKSYGLLIVGLILLAASIILTVYARKNSYVKSVEIGSQLSAVKEEINNAEKNNQSDGLEELNHQKEVLSAQKLDLERPFSYGLTALFFAVLLLLKGIYNAIVGLTSSQKRDIKKTVQAGLLAALCYIGFAFFKIDIPVGPEKTAFHFGNVFCVLAALLLGGYWGGLAGAVGMTIGDLTTAYVTSAPKTFLLKLMIGLIVGLVAHTLFKLSRAHSPKFVTGVTILAAACGMGFNVIADPLVGYFYKMYLLGVPQDISAALAKISTVTTGVNAVVAVIAASVIYLALRPALKKSGLFVQVTPEAEKV